MDACQYRTDPQACFARVQQSHLQKRNRHSWESIGPCGNCRYAYGNAVKAFVPEPDVPPRQSFSPSPDPNDFRDTPLRRKGRTPKLECSRGHRYAVHGSKRKDGRWRCRKCESNRVRSGEAARAKAYRARRKAKP